MSRTEEDFELELRSLPGVLNVGMSHRESGDVGVITLTVSNNNPALTRFVASRIASLYFPDAVLVVDDVEGAVMPERRAPRVAFVHAEFSESDSVCEVRLAFEGQNGVGRAANGPLIGGAEATLGALRDLGYTVPYSIMSVTSVTAGRAWPVIVALHSLTDDADLFGIARSDDDLVSAVRATLNALNRFLSLSQRAR